MSRELQEVYDGFSSTYRRVKELFEETHLDILHLVMYIEQTTTEDGPVSDCVRCEPDLVHAYRNIFLDPEREEVEDKKDKKRKRGCETVANDEKRAVTVSVTKTAFLKGGKEGVGGWLDDGDLSTFPAWTFRRRLSIARLTYSTRGVALPRNGCRQPPTQTRS